MRKLFALVTVLSVFPAACKKRSNDELRESSNQAATADASEANLDRLKQERNNLISQLEAQQVEGAKKIAELTLERDELNAQKTSVELDISRLEKEMEAAATQEQKDQTRTKLTAAIQERDNLNVKLQGNADTIKELLKKMDSLSDEIRKANAKISELNDRIESLEKQLAVERSKVETISTTQFPKADPTTSAASTTTSTLPTTSTPTPTPTASPSSTPTTTPAPTPGVVSQIAWQFFRKNADATVSCFEFGSTLANASLLGLPCVTPVPVRQQFKTETFGSNFLIVDQRTQMCVRLDSTATTPAAARIVLGACKRGGDMDELFNFYNVNTDTGEFQFRSTKTGNCLHFADDKKIVQLACGQASNILSIP